MIPYPTVVELPLKPDGSISKDSKTARQHVAKIQMTKRGEKLREERKKAKEEFEEIQEQLKAPDTDKEKAVLKDGAVTSDSDLLRD